MTSRGFEPRTLDPKSKLLDTFVGSFAEGFAGVAIGLKSKSNNWVWTDNTVVDYTKWSCDYMGPGGCGFINKKNVDTVCGEEKYQWVNGVCESSGAAISFICKISL